MRTGFAGAVLPDFAVDSPSRSDKLPAHGKPNTGTGDVLMELKKVLPSTREKLPHTILAHGEVTGHSHRIKESGGADLYATSDGPYLHVRGDAATIVYEEHALSR